MSPQFLNTLLTVHVIGFIYWLGGTFGAGWLLIARGAEQDVFFKRNMAVLSRRLGVSADVGATLTIATGLVMAIKGHFFSQGWLHFKLTGVVVLLALYIVTRIKSKQASTNDAVAYPSVIPLLIGVVTAAIAYFAVFRPGA